jgi:hypothetical protein
MLRQQFHQILLSPRSNTIVYSRAFEALIVHLQNRTTTTGANSGNRGVPAQLLQAARSAGTRPCWFNFSSIQLDGVVLTYGVGIGDVAD